MRAFIAIELPAAVKKELADMQDRLRKSGLKARWVRPENIHLTLKFLGNIDPGDVDSICAALKSVATKFEPVALTAAGIGVFPHARKARVLWAGLSDGVPNLIELQSDLDAALTACGFAREKRPFRGHLTLARFRDRANPDRLQSALEQSSNVRFGQWTAGQLVLFQSDLRPAGPVYSQLASFPLGE